MKENCDVLIVGAGPTGLTLACELYRHGLRARIIDMAEHPTAYSKAQVVHARTLELFEDMGVLELDQPVDVARVSEAALDRGVWVRPFRNLVYTMPPYVATTEDVRTITDALVGAVAEVHR